jgi:predicted RND superfamily exporter protein
VSQTDTPAERLSSWLVEHPVYVVVAFLLVTAFFAGGLGGIEMEAGPEMFSEDVEAYAVNEEVDETFEPSFETEDDRTLLLQSGKNVLSKKGLLRMLELQYRIEERESLRVTETRSTARIVARGIDPSARTTEDLVRSLEEATPTEVRRVIRKNADKPRFTELLGEDFNTESASASAALGVVRHDTLDDALFEKIQAETGRVANSMENDMRVFGSGVTDRENRRVLQDSLRASIPAVILLLLLFLAVAYRDPFDLFLGVTGLAMTLIWTFGFLGRAGITFSQLQVALPPLLLAIGVDFGIHLINRYREEFEGDIHAAMEAAVSPLAVAFFMVMSTSVIGFSANLASGLSPIADFGIVAAAGIVSVTLIFGVFLPSAKVLVESLREDTILPTFSRGPMGAEGSVLGRVLPFHLSVTSRFPVVFLVLVVLAAGLAGYYGKGVESSFEDEDMLPPEDIPPRFGYLPGPMEPGTYTVAGSLRFLEEEFVTSPEDTVTVYLDGPMHRDDVLESIHRMGEDPPSSFVTREARRADSESIITVIEEYADESEEFAEVVERNDINGNGVPDSNLEEVYDRLMSSPYGDRALRYLTEDYSEARVVYSVETDASDGEITSDAASVADEAPRGFGAVETGGVVVFQRVTDEIFRSAINSLAIAMTLALAFLTSLYYYLERRPWLGLVTVSPIAVTLLFLVATMRYLGVPFNTLTATILSVTVGIGIDYSIHIVHRFVEEFEARPDALQAVRVTLQGTGGALFGTTVTTMGAGATLYSLSLTPILIQFGLLIALSVAYAFLASVVVLPVVLIVYVR